MGTWGLRPFDNDTAADWFGDLWDEVPLPKRVEKTLQQEVEEFNHDEIRAAAYVLIQLGHVYVWPIHDLEHHLELAVSKLKEVKKFYEGEEEFEKEIQGEIDLLQERLNKMKR